MKIIFFLLSYLLLPSLSSAENLGQLDADARILVLDSTNTTRQRFDDSTVYEYLNQGMRQAVAQSYCLEQNIVFSLVPGIQYYTLPSNYEEITRVTIGQKYIPQQSVAALDGKSRGWEAATGYPTYYFINFSSRSLIGFAPFPATATDTDTIKVEFNIAPTDMVLTTDLPFNGISELQVYDHMLAYYAAAIMAQVNDMSEQAKDYMSIYTSLLTTMSQKCMVQGQYLPSASASP